MTDTFKPPAPLQTAVLFLVFNRPDTTAQVFEAIRKAKPPRLYVAADGPRPDRTDEAEKVAKVREIATAVDWPCEVKTLFREENLGCKYAVSGGITWFFDHEEQGIILEDDCLPHPVFFTYCEENLVAYKYLSDIWAICGWTPFNIKIPSRSDYLSSYPSVWGWATWRDRWLYYDAEIFKKSNRDAIRVIPSRLLQYIYWVNFLNLSILSKIDTWDYQFTYLVVSRRGSALRPTGNLVKNIGFGVDATHTVGPDIETQLSNQNPLGSTARHPDLIDAFLDFLLFMRRFGLCSFIKLLAQRMRHG